MGLTDWHIHLASYRSTRPGLPMRKAMKEASVSWRKFRSAGHMPGEAQKSLAKMKIPKSAPSTSKSMATPGSSSSSQHQKVGYMPSGPAVGQSTDLNDRVQILKDEIKSAIIFVNPKIKVPNGSCVRQSNKKGSVPTITVYMDRGIKYGPPDHKNPKSEEELHELNRTLMAVLKWWHFYNGDVKLKFYPLTSDLYRNNLAYNRQFGMQVWDAD